MTGPAHTGRTVVAGVGNLFMRDDAFGSEAARLVAELQLPPGVEVRDFGISSVHLAYDLLNGCDLFVLIDAAARGCEPGTVTVLEVDPEDFASTPVIDPHGLSPDGIFAYLLSLGARPGRSLLVACEPADLSAGIGLSDPVRAALPHAVRAVQDILAEAHPDPSQSGPSQPSPSQPSPSRPSPSQPSPSRPSPSLSGASHSGKSRFIQRRGINADLSGPEDQMRYA